MRTIRKYRKGGGTSEIFSRLIEINNELNHDILIDSLHIVHERKWYMEIKDYLYTKKLK